MKKFIIMSLAVFAIALISCKSDQQKCEDEGKTWIAEGEKCISPEQKDCEDKDDKTWNAEENKCEEKSDAQTECEAQEGKKWENDQCVDQLFTILFKSSEGGVDDYLLFSPGGKIRPFQCVKVATSQFKDLKISVLRDIWAPGDNEEVLCDNDDNTLEPPCLPSNYDVLWSPSKYHPATKQTIPGLYKLVKKDQAEDCTVVNTIK